MRQSQRILAVVNDRALYEKVAGPLERSSFEVNRVPSGAGALILVGNLRYDLILLQAPLPDLDLPDFLAAVRTIDCPCAGSSVIVLARDESVADPASTSLDDSVTVMPASVETAEIQSQISQSLGVAVRAATRIVVQIEAHLEEGVIQRVGQTANMSETGMLLTGAPTLPIGAGVDLTMELPGDPRPLTVSGEVIRHAAPEVENVTGIGVRFVNVSSETAERLREFLAARRDQTLDAEDEAMALDLDEQAGSAG